MTSHWCSPLPLNHPAQGPGVKSHLMNQLKTIVSPFHIHPGIPPPAVPQLLCCHIHILVKAKELSSMQLLGAIQARLTFFHLLLHLLLLLRGEEEREAGKKDQEGQCHHLLLSPLSGISIDSGFRSPSYCVRQRISCSPFLPPFVTPAFPLPTP